MRTSDQANAESMPRHESDWLEEVVEEARKAGARARVHHEPYDLSKLAKFEMYPGCKRRR